MERAKKALAPVACLLVGACLSTIAEDPLPPPPDGALDLYGPLQGRVLHDREAREVTLFAGPFDVPAAPAGGGHTGHHHVEEGDGRSPLIPFTWPVDAGLQSVRLAIRDRAGNEYPRDVIHHLIGVNFARRQLVYPVIERLFGFGSETDDVALPDFLEVPLARGDSLGVWVMWNNTTGEDLKGMVVQVVFEYAPPDEAQPREPVYPIYMDTHFEIGVGTGFDLPPGVSTWSYEFELPVGGGLLASGGHLHRYGRVLRLEEVETGRVLIELEPERGPDGRVLSIERKIFRRFFNLLDARLPLERGVRYRVVGVYDNPTQQRIEEGGMAHIVGLFAPNDTSMWPRLDPDRPEYKADRAQLPPMIGSAEPLYGRVGR